MCGTERQIFITNLAKKRERWCRFMINVKSFVRLEMFLLIVVGLVALGCGRGFGCGGVAAGFEIASIGRDGRIRVDPSSGRASEIESAADGRGRSSGHVELVFPLLSSPRRPASASV